MKKLRPGEPSHSVAMSEFQREPQPYPLGQRLSGASAQGLKSGGGGEVATRAHRGHRGPRKQEGASGARCEASSIAEACPPPFQAAGKPRPLGPLLPRWPLAQLHTMTGSPGNESVVGTRLLCRMNVLGGGALEWPKSPLGWGGAGLPGCCWEEPHSLALHPPATLCGIRLRAGVQGDQEAPSSPSTPRTQRPTGPTGASLSLRLGSGPRGQVVTHRARSRGQEPSQSSEVGGQRLRM